MNEDRPVRLFITDDRRADVDIYTERLAKYADIEIVGHASYPDEMILQLKQMDPKPDVVLLDLYYPGWTTDQEAVFEIVREVSRLMPNIVMIGHTAFYDDARHLPQRAKDAGCTEVITKSPNVGYLQVHDRIVTLGRTNWDHRLTWRQLQATETEIEVFLGRVQGLAREEIAERRGDRAVRTVKTQELKARERLAAATGETIQDMTKAVAVALRWRLIEPRHITDRDWPPRR